MSQVQLCEGCGAHIGDNVEGFGVKAGYKDKVFDFCSECMAEVESFFLEKMGVAEKREVTIVVPTPSGDAIVKEIEKAADKALRESLEAEIDELS